MCRGLWFAVICCDHVSDIESKRFVSSRFVVSRRRSSLARADGQGPQPVSLPSPSHTPTEGSADFRRYSEAAMTLRKGSRNTEKSGGF